MSPPLGALAHEMEPAPQEVTGRPPLGGIDVGLGQHPAAQEDRNLGGIKGVVLGLSAVKSLHREGMAQDENIKGLEMTASGVRSCLASGPWS
jgi:hypothetical protein